MKLFGYLITALAILPPSAFGAEITEYGCKLMVTEGGENTTVDALDLHILDYNKDYQLVRFESDGPRRVNAVICSRSSVIPAAYDYQVILAGVPFYIGAGERVVVLEFKDNVYRLRLIDGPPFTEEEQAEVTARLKSFPLERSLPSAPPNNSFKPKPLRGSA